MAKAKSKKDAMRPVTKPAAPQTARLNVTTLARDLLATLVRMGPITPICQPQCRVLTAPPFEEHSRECEYEMLVNRATEVLA